MKRSAGSRSTANLSESVHSRLNAYALAATAAGVGLLALVPPSEAKIVYHRVQFVIDPLHTCHLDLNHDGVIDFTLQLRQKVRGTWYFENYLSAVPAKNNGVVGQKGRQSFWSYASALTGGSSVGPKKPFFGTLVELAGLDDVPFYIGLWFNVTNRYLGLKFKVHGQTHYGWARMTVKVYYYDTQVIGILTGYAYETIPNKAIIAGRTKGKMNDKEASPDSLTPDNRGPGASLTNPVPETPHPASLGLLAIGSLARSIWRRKESVGATW